MTKKEPQKPAHERFLDSCAKVGEHFPEFLMIVKTDEGFMDWRSSDKTWAMGAAERYLNLSHTEDETNLWRKKLDENESR